MAAVAPVLTARVQSGYLVTSWTSTNQHAFKVSITKVVGGRLEDEPSYGTEARKGQFASELERDGTPQAHLITGSSEQRIRWDGRRYSSGRVCNGDYEVRMYYINDQGERSTTDSARVRVDGYQCTDPSVGTLDNRDGELPAPTITMPTEGQTINASNVLLVWTIPDDYAQVEYKAAVYPEDRIDPETNNTLGPPLYGTIRSEAHRDSHIRAHWAVGGTDRATFSDTSNNANNQICDGDYVVRLRYRDGLGNESLPAVRRFKVTGVPCDPPDATPEEPTAPTIPTDTGGMLTIKRIRPYRTGIGYPIDTSRNDFIEWYPVFGSGRPQAEYEMWRVVSRIQVGPPGNRQGVRRTETWYWNATTQRWQSTSVRNASAIPQAILVGGAPSTAQFNATKDRYFFSNAWYRNDDSEGPFSTSRVALSVRAYDDQGNMTANTTSSIIDILPFSLLDAPSPMTVTQTAPATPGTPQRPHINMTSRYAGRGNEPSAAKISVYKKNADGSRGDLIQGTIQFEGQSLAGRDSAYWIDMMQVLGGGLQSDSVALRFDMEPQQYFGGHLEAGDFVVVGKWRDLYGNITGETSVEIDNYTPAAPRIMDIRPFRVSGFNDDGVPQFVGPLTGYADGEAIALAYYETAETSSSDPPVRDLVIERRVRDRLDRRYPNSRPVEVFRWEDRRLDAVPWPTGLVPAVPTGTVWWFIDDTAQAGIGYEYRVTLIGQFGGRRTRPWVP